MQDTELLHRRTVLGSIATSIIAAVSGCVGSRSSDDGSSTPSGFSEIYVDQTDLVLQLEDDHPFTAVTVIQPDGTLFDEHSIAAGVTQVTTEIGTDYLPGEFEIIGSTDEGSETSTGIEIRPEVEIVELLLGRNHPEEMFEGASERRSRLETILTVENKGTGPDAVTGLSFQGDIPQPTPAEYRESGIYDTNSPISNHADQVAISVDETKPIYSYSSPFNFVGENAECMSQVTSGQFEVSLESVVSEGPVKESYSVDYTGESSSDCEVVIGEDS